MNFISAGKLAIKGILSNKVRSFLTMLGVIIGVCTVIILVSVGKGATASVTENISSMGSNLISLSIMGRGAKTSLTDADIQKIAALSGGRRRFADLERIGGSEIRLDYHGEHFPGGSHSRLRDHQ